MNVLFLHQNFPAQYRHLATALAAVPGNRVVAMGMHDNVMGRPVLPGVETLAYKRPAPPGAQTHPYLRDFEGAVRRGQQIVRALLELRGKGFLPDVVCVHPGWGEMLFVKEAFPEARVLGYFEFFYRVTGSDVGFDPEYPASLDDRCRVRAKNSTMLLSLDVADAGVTPTRWQHAQYPGHYQPKISVIHEGVNTDLITPLPGAQLSLPLPGQLPGGHVLTRDDEVITYVSRNLEPYRGFHTFMRALPALLAKRPKAQVVVVGGDGVSYGVPAPAGATYRKRLLDELGDQLDVSRVHFLGTVPYDVFLTVLRISSAHVYLTYPFVLSWSMLEAMSAGCLVIGSRTPPVEEVIADGVNGWLCDFFDPAALAQRMADALAAGASLDGLRRAARQTIVERYDLVRHCLPQQIALVNSLAAAR